MKTIPLTRGMSAIVDDEDYERISSHKWHASKSQHGTWYATRTQWIGAKKLNVWMHREILYARPGEQVDHRNRNGLDNRRENIRACSHSQNQHNQPKEKGTSSKYRGVTFDKNRKNYIAQIGFDRKNIYIGRYSTEVEAAEAYDKKANELYGDFAVTNF